MVDPEPRMRPEHLRVRQCVPGTPLLAAENTKNKDLTMNSRRFVGACVGDGGMGHAHDLHLVQAVGSAGRVVQSAPAKVQMCVDRL